LPFGGALERAVNEWEIAQGFGDSPKEKSAWDAEYSDGRWAYIGQLHENSRYWTLIGYMHSFKGGGEYLDVSCGDGVLFERFKLLGYQRYVGIDISDVAIDRLCTYNDDRTNFIQADGNVHEPSGRFDVIVFNESLYYLRNPIRSLERYAQSLKPGGSIIISTYTASRRSLAVYGRRSEHSKSSTRRRPLKDLCLGYAPYLNSQESKRGCWHCSLSSCS
jgi:SAM-dependent methyltransferase